MPTRTEDYPLPSAAPAKTAVPALIAAFPVPRALPIPPSREVVGRDWLARAGIADKRVSTKHLVFSRPGGALQVEDAGSHNGTWLDGVQLRSGKPTALQDGSLLRIGNTILVVREALTGPWEPSPPIGDLVGPYGLRDAAAALDGIRLARPASVLLEGETGTGKELVAAAAAAALERARPYGAISVAEIAESVFESHLFGYVRGAYSGAGPGSPGVIAAHKGGAVFLDEIGELPLPLQAKLLRVLDRREVLPVGATAPVKIDVAILAATHRPLADMVEAGTFRRDLYARLAEWPIELSPLRDRAEDIFAIAQALRARHHRPLDLSVVEVAAVERLLLHPWPANVRELAAVLGRAAVLDPPGALRLETLNALLPRLSTPARPVLTEETVRAALERGGSEVKAAKLLNVTRSRLRRFRERA